MKLFHYCSVRCHYGFTLIELMIALAIIGIIMVIAVPSYQNYTRRAHYSEIVNATAPYKLGVTECYQISGNLNSCEGGSNNVPSDINSPIGGIASLTVNNGIITVTPVAQNGFETLDTYILTPTANSGTLIWTPSGGGVDKGYAKK